MLAAPPWVRAKKTHGFTRKTLTTTKLQRKNSRSWGQTCHKKNGYTVPPSWSRGILKLPYQSLSLSLLHVKAGGLIGFVDTSVFWRCNSWKIWQFYHILSHLSYVKKNSGVQPKLLKSLRIFIGQGGHESKIHQTQWGWSTCRIVHVRRLSTWRNKQGIDVFIDVFTHGET